MDKLEKALLLVESVPPHLQRLLLENAKYSQSDNVEAVFDRLAHGTRSSVNDILENGMKKVPIHQDVVALKWEYGMRNVHGDFGAIYEEFSDRELSNRVATISDGNRGQGESHIAISSFRWHLIIAYGRCQWSWTRWYLRYGNALVIRESDIPYGWDLTPIIGAFPSKVPDQLQTRTDWDKTLVWSEWSMEIQEKDLLLQNILRVTEGKTLVFPKSTDINYICAFLLDVYSFLPLHSRSKFGARVQAFEFGTIEPPNWNVDWTWKDKSFEPLSTEEVLKIKDVLEKILWADDIQYIEFTLNKEILLTSIMWLLMHNPGFLTPESLVAIYNIWGFGREVLVWIWRNLVTKIGSWRDVSSEDIRVFWLISHDIDTLLRTTDTDNFLGRLDDRNLSTIYLVCKEHNIFSKWHIVRILIGKLSRGIEDSSFWVILEEVVGWPVFSHQIDILPESQFKMLIEHAKSQWAKKDCKDAILKRIWFPANLLLKWKIRDL